MYHVIYDFCLYFYKKQDIDPILEEINVDLYGFILTAGTIFSTHPEIKDHTYIINYCFQYIAMRHDKREKLCNIDKIILNFNNFEENTRQY
jgi:hypothetical protein